MKPEPESAAAMLDHFASVGARSFDLTITDIDQEKVSYRRGVAHAGLATSLPFILSSATAKQRNVIVRPHGPGVSFVQLDDLDAGRLATVAPAVFLTLQTSPGSFQAWMTLDALADAEADKDLARRLRKGTGADATASGATRIAGSLNFKNVYAPDFPRVAIVAAEPGRRTTVDELLHHGLLAAPAAEPAPRRQPARFLGDGRPSTWPDYARCVERAPLNSAKDGPDISRADFVWCMTALDWGWSQEATAGRLMELSTKAQENGERYAVLTVANAAAAVARRSVPSPRQTRILDQK